MSSSKDNNVFKKTSFLQGNNSAFIEEFYSQYIENPESLPESWQNFFKGLDDDISVVSKNINGPSWSPKKRENNFSYKQINLNKEPNDYGSDLKSVEQAAKDSVRAIMLIRAYRIRGHLIANLDPLNLQKKSEHSELNPETYGFTKKDYNRKIFLDGVLGLKYADLSQIISILKRTYSSNIGYEFMHMGDPEEKAWIRNRVEGPEKEINFTDNGKLAIFNKIAEAEIFEKYLHVKFIGTKRFGLDGGES